MATNQWWSSVGSAGTVDVADLGKVAFDKSSVQLQGFDLVVSPSATQAEADRSAIALPTVRAVVRYGVTPVEGVLTGAQLYLVLRYRDGSGHIAANLIEVDINAGTETTRITFDSKDGNSVHDDAFQVYASKDYYSSFDFRNHAYYVELILTASQPLLRPVIFPPKVSVIQLKPPDVT
jgi:hypothetical protein